MKNTDFKQHVDRYLESILEDKFQEDEDGNTQYDLIDKDSVLEAIEYVKENGNPALSYEEILDEPSLEEAINAVTTDVVRLAIKNNIKKDPSLSRSEVSDYFIEYRDLFNDKMDLGRVSDLIRRIFQV